MHDKRKSSFLVHCSRFPSSSSTAAPGLVSSLEEFKGLRSSESCLLAITALTPDVCWCSRRINWLASANVCFYVVRYLWLGFAQTRTYPFFNWKIHCMFLSLLWPFNRMIWPKTFCQHWTNVFHWFHTECWWVDYDIVVSRVLWVLDRRIFYEIVASWFLRILESVMIQSNESRRYNWLRMKTMTSI